MPTTPVSTPRAWRSHARDLAAWTIQHLVNRTDVYGSYLTASARAAKKNAITKTSTLTESILVAHYQGDDVGELIGLHTTSPDGYCRWVGLDIDHHGDRDPARHRQNRSAAIALFRRIRDLGFDPILTGSNGRGGYHLLVPFEKSVPSATAYRFGQWLIRDWDVLGLTEAPEAFPRQPKLTRRCRYGNWLRLPGRHHSFDHWSNVWDGKKWLRGTDAVRHILGITGRTAINIPAQVFTFDCPGIDLVPEPDQVRQRPRLTQGQSESPIGKFLALLANVRTCGDGWSARCPGHGDRNNSLSVQEGDDGKVLLHCHTGCDLDDILEALEVEASCLFPRSRRRTRKRPTPQRRFRSRRCGE